jgi:hypothetical protein
MNSKFFKTKRNQYVVVTQAQLTRSGLYLQYHNDVKTGKLEYALVFRDYILGMVYYNEKGSYETELSFPPFHVSCYIMSLVLEIMKRLAAEDVSGMLLDLRDYLNHRPQERPI